MATAFVAGVMESFEAPITNYVQNTASAVADAVAGPISLGAIIYIAITGIMIATGAARASAFDFIWNCIRVCIVVILATKNDAYNYYVSELFFTTIPDSVSQLLVSAAPGGGISGSAISSGAAFDNVINKSIDIGFSIADKAAWTDVATRFFGYAFVYTGVIIMTLIALVVLFAKIGLALMLAIGPIFIALALFDATRSYTSNWVSMLANFVILQILIFGLFGLLLSIVDSSIDATAASSGGDAFTSAAIGIGSFVLALVVASHLPGMASALSSGGLHLGSSVMGSALGTTRSSANFMGAQAARGVRNTAIAGWNAGKRALARSNRISKD